MRVIEPIRFFFDGNLSPGLAAGLCCFGEKVEHLTQRFRADDKDSRWLQFIGEQGITLVTRDRRILSRPLEIDAFRTYKVGAFFLSGKKLTRCRLIQQLVARWPDMKELARTNERPSAFTVRPYGTKIERVPI